MNPILVDVQRGGSDESQHRGALAVVDADGGVVMSLGDIERPVFPRSAVKVLQALPLVASGAADRLGLDDAELALACASHNGEEAHVRTAAAMLAKAGLGVDALECGTHWPYLDTAVRALAAAGREPNALNNNCSGKHAGFLCLACALHGRPNLRDYVRGYVAAEHPVMREVTAALQATTGVDLAAAPRGIGLIKRAVNHANLPSLESDLEYEANLQEIAGRSSDYDEGVRAFLEKREPIFTGK